MLEQAGARSAWRYSGGSIQFHHSPTKRCNSLAELIGNVAPVWASVVCRLGV